MPAVPGRDPLREVVQHWHEAGVPGRAIHAVLKREHGFGGSYSASYALLRQLRAEQPLEVTVRLAFMPGEAA